MYTLPYFASKKKPSVILSYVIPGNMYGHFFLPDCLFICSYPVKEHHKSADSLLGKPLQSGYNSHYIVTTKSGVCISEEREGIAESFNSSWTLGSTYDELVIPLEGQIVPAFIFEISNENFSDVCRLFAVVLDLRCSWMLAGIVRSKKNLDMHVPIGATAVTWAETWDSLMWWRWRYAACFVRGDLAVLTCQEI